jgi:hypothetical protein
MHTIIVSLFPRYAARQLLYVAWQFSLGLTKIVTLRILQKRKLLKQNEIKNMLWQNAKTVVCASR